MAPLPPSRCDARLESNGGFIQVALALAPEGGTLDVSSYADVLLKARAIGESHGVHLRTPARVCPWQAYRVAFVADPEWREIRLPFNQFEPHG